ERDVAVGEHRGYAPIVHRRTAALHAKARAAALMDELYGGGEHRFELRFILPRTDVELREATDEERDRFELLHEDGLSFGYDFTRCVAVGDVALFAFGATLPWALRINDTDVSPGYAETRAAKELLVSAKGTAPARLFTAVLRLK